MASLQELRKRLRSIRSIEQLAGAMRTAATVKYSRLCRIRNEFKPYASASEDMLHLLGVSGLERKTDQITRRSCIVVFSGNRGLCGGFHTELFHKLERTLNTQLTQPLVLVSGRKAAAWLRERSVPFEEYPASDIPVYNQIKPMADRAEQLYVDGEVESIFVLYQRYLNMLKQEPTLLQFLPENGFSILSGGAEDDKLMFFPEKGTISGQIEDLCLDAELFDLALENATGVQAATMMSMRSACDNARTAAAELETTINRRRQAEITSSVIETASGAQGE